MKKIFCAACIIALSLGMAACSQNTGDNSSPAENTDVSAFDSEKVEVQSTVVFSVEGDITSEDYEEIITLLGTRFNNSFPELQYTINKDFEGKTVQFVFVKPEEMTEEYLTTLTLPNYVRIKKGNESDSGVIAENANIVEVNVRKEENTNRWAIFIKLDEEGKKKLSDATQEMLGSEDPITVMIDGEEIVSAYIQTPVTDGEFYISGEYTEQEAKKTASRINGGYLRFKVSVKESDLAM